MNKNKNFNIIVNKDKQRFIANVYDCTTPLRSCYLSEYRDFLALAITICIDELFKTQNAYSALDFTFHHERIFVSAEFVDTVIRIDIYDCYAVKNSTWTLVECMDYCKQSMMNIDSQKDDYRAFATTFYLKDDTFSIVTKVIQTLIYESLKAKEYDVATSDSMNESYRRYIHSGYAGMEFIISL